jgi:hypothetical protein
MPTYRLWPPAQPPNSAAGDHSRASSLYSGFAQTTLQRRLTMTDTNIAKSEPVLLAINISKARHEVLNRHSGQKTVAAVDRSKPDGRLQSVDRNTVGLWLSCSRISTRRYFLMVLRDSPIRRAISRIGILSLNAHRRITLKNLMSITLISPNTSYQEQGCTWVISQ